MGWRDGMTLRSAFARLDQERIVLAIAVLVFIVASATLDGFLTTANLVNIVRSDSATDKVSLRG